MKPRELDDGHEIADVPNEQMARVRFPRGRGDDDPVKIEYDDRNTWVPMSVFEQSFGSELRLPKNVPEHARDKIPDLPDRGP